MVILRVILAIRKRRKLQHSSKAGESRLEQVPQTKNTVAVLNELKRNLVYKVESQTGPVHAPIFTISVVVSIRHSRREEPCVCVCVCVVLTKAVCKMVACAILRVCQLTEEPAGAAAAAASSSAAAEASCWANCFYFVVFFYLFLHDTHTPPPFADFSC